MINQGSKFKHNDLIYTVVGKDKKSYLLDCSNGRKYKATESKIKENMMQIEEGTGTFEVSSTPYIQARLNQSKLFGSILKVPTNKAECEVWFNMLEGELSPENLHCDGEISSAQVARKLKEIKGLWKELEKIAKEKRTMNY